MSDAALVAWFRRFLLLTTGAMCLGVIAELALTGHTEAPLQWAPLIACALGLAVLGWALIQPRRAALRALQGVMIVAAVAGAVGTFAHLSGNLELAREARPDAAQSAPVLAALTGGNPPLAPGAMAVIALVGLAATYRHPALRPTVVAAPRDVVNNLPQP